MATPAMNDSRVKPISPPLRHLATHWKICDRIVTKKCRRMIDRDYAGVTFCRHRSGGTSKSGGSTMKAYICLFLGLFLLGSIPASAQVQATIVGTVTDPSGAAVPGAHITIINSAKGFTHLYTSNSAGEYTGADIPIGEYKVEVEATGFQRLIRSNITLDA